MKPPTHLFSPLLLLHNASFPKPNVLERGLNLRQSCPAGEKECGNQNCILNSYSCCPDGSGGCPRGQYCSLGDNGEWGCCPNNKLCAGNGGASTTGTYSYTSTYTDESSPTTVPACTNSRLTATDGAVYTKLCGTNYFGADDKSNIIAYRDNIGSLLRCVEICEHTTDCVAVDRYVVDRPGHGPANRCFLLSNTDSGFNNPDAVNAASRLSDALPTSTDEASTTSSSDSAASTGLISSTSSAAAATSTVSASSDAVGNLSWPFDSIKGSVWLVCSTSMAVIIFLPVILL